MEIENLKELITKTYQNELGLYLMLQPNNPVINISKAIKLNNSLKGKRKIIKKELKRLSKDINDYRSIKYLDLVTRYEEINSLNYLNTEILSMYKTAYEREHNTKIV